MADKYAVEVDLNIVRGDNENAVRANATKKMMLTFVPSLDFTYHDDLFPQDGLKVRTIHYDFTTDTFTLMLKPMNTGGIELGDCIEMFESNGWKVANHETD